MVVLAACRVKPQQTETALQAVLLLIHLNYFLDTGFCKLKKDDGNVQMSPQGSPLLFTDPVPTFFVRIQLTTHAVI